jgi:hypothetical protein
MRIFDIAANGMLERIFDNTASKIICNQWDIADPNDSCSNDTKAQNEIADRINPLIKKDWYDLLEKYDIQCVPIKIFKRIFYKDKHFMLDSFASKLLCEELSLDEIYNQHLKYDDKVAVLSEDAAGIQDYDSDKPDSYPVFLMSQETFAKIAKGYDVLKKEDPDISDRSVTISKAIEAAGDYSYEVVKTDIKYEDLPVLRQIVIDKIETAITKTDKYYFYSTNEHERMVSFLQDHNIELIYKIALTKNFNTDEWMLKDEHIEQYCFFKNLHLLNLKRNSRDVIERPATGFLCFSYKQGMYFIVPKDLASAWLKESLVNA